MGALSDLIQDPVKRKAVVNDSVRAAKIACFKTTRGFETGDLGLGIIGPVGTGKTHLMAALVRELTLTDGVATRFVAEAWGGGWSGRELVYEDGPVRLGPSPAFS